jgi:hypothetical protein
MGTPGSPRELGADDAANSETPELEATAHDDGALDDDALDGVAGGGNGGNFPILVV